MAEKHMEPFPGAIEPRWRENLVFYRHKVKDFLFVMEGCLAFRGNERIIKPAARDGLYFDAAILHAVRALDDFDAKVMAVLDTSPAA
jgi:hypothetical protein